MTTSPAQRASASVLVRSARMGDFENYRAAVAAVAREQGLSEALTDSEARAWFTATLEDKHPFVVALCNGQLVGWCGAAPAAGARGLYTAALQGGVIAEHRRRGTGGRMVRLVKDSAYLHGLHRIELDVPVENWAALALLEGNGFRRLSVGIREAGGGAVRLGLLLT